MFPDVISSAFSSSFACTRKPAEVVAGRPPRQSSGNAGDEGLRCGRPRALDGEDGSVGQAAGRRRQWHQALMLNESDDNTVWSSSAKSGDAGSRVRPQRLRRTARQRRGACPVPRLRLRKLLTGQMPDARRGRALRPSSAGRGNFVNTTTTWGARRARSSRPSSEQSHVSLPALARDLLEALPCFWRQVRPGLFHRNVGHGLVRRQFRRAVLVPLRREDVEAR